MILTFYLDSQTINLEEISVLCIIYVLKFVSARLQSLGKNSRRAKININMLFSFHLSDIQDFFYIFILENFIRQRGNSTSIRMYGIIFHIIDCFCSFCFKKYTLLEQLFYTGKKIFRVFIIILNVIQIKIDQKSKLSNKLFEYFL